MLQGAVPPRRIDADPEAIQAGFPSIKIFTTDMRPHRQGPHDPHRHTVGHHGEGRPARRHRCAIHAEDDDIVMYMYEQLEREGRTDIEHMPLVHSAMSEDISFRRVLRLARYVEGAAVYFVHVSAGGGRGGHRRGARRGPPIYGETLHHYATFTAEAYLRPDGVMFHTYPSLKHEARPAGLWAGLKNGTLSTVATDELCTPRAIKVRSRHIADATGGHVGVETRAGRHLHRGWSKRGMSLERFVAVTSTNAAQDPRPLSAQGRDRPGQRRRHRRLRSQRAPHAALGRSARLRLQRRGTAGRSAPGRR